MVSRTKIEAKSAQERIYTWMLMFWPDQAVMGQSSLCFGAPKVGCIPSGVARAE